MYMHNIVFAFYLFGCGGDGNEDEEGDGGPAVADEERGGEEEESGAEGVAGAVDWNCCCCCCSTFSLRDGWVKKAELHGPTPSTGRSFSTVKRWIMIEMIKK